MFGTTTRIFEKSYVILVGAHANVSKKRFLYKSIDKLADK